MKKYYEVIRQILPLLETIEEAILHIQKQLKELRYEEALDLLEDSTIGIASIEKAMQPMMPELQENNIASLIARLKEKIDNAVNIYEKKKEENLQKQIEGEILPAFTEWKEEMDRLLKPYIAF